MHPHRRLLMPSLALVVLALVPACAAKHVCDDDACTSSKPTGVVHGVRPDGRVDVSARDAWPSRAAEPGPLTAVEIAQACAILGACGESTAHPPSAGDDDALAMITSLCAFPEGSEERAIPKDKSNERWSWQVRAILAAPRCDAVSALPTTREESIRCEEDGCWWSSSTLPLPAVTCAGDVATMTTEGKTITRDCAHAYAKCDASSPTGCTDRHPVACDAKGKDRCDGDVKLGCDSSGRVSFHDCTRDPGSHCVESADGAKCTPAETSSCQLQDQRCDGSKLTVCVSGAKTVVDCADFGFSCRNGHCAR